ncbi:hypothetical protein A8U91_03443 [Halomonas elongata]|uniref:Uncharacterized protein n=1 Tax=Halomonas elongata TaxID=2746 RepID=A0A1B8NWL5_HALEL|nr:hypothetical protein A8U91_03443 [Halomonas elongata]
MAGDGVAEGALAFLGEPAHEAGTVLDLTTGIGQGLALLQGHDGGQVLAVGLQQVIPGQQTLAALVGAQRAPLHECRLGGVHRTPDLLDFQHRDMADGLASGGIEDGLLTTGIAVSPLAVDIGILTEQSQIAELVGQRHKHLP